MTATADLIIERRGARRRLAFWRILAIIAVVVAAIALIPAERIAGGPFLARVTVDGIILNDAERERAIRSLADNDDVRGVIVTVNSPGGTVVASEAIYLALRDVAARKPVVSVMAEYAASGGYVTAIAGEHIVARGNTVTGSIGVVAEVPNISGLMEMLGVEVTRIKSAPLKAEPSITEAPSPAALAAQRALIMDMFAWFEGLVSERRNLSGPALAEVTDGRAFTGRQALELGLVDAIGDERTAIAWLAENRGIDAAMPVRELEWGDDELPWPLDLMRGALAGLAASEPHFSPVPRLYAIIQ